MVLPFVHIFLNRSMRIQYVAIIVIASALFARIFQNWFLGFADTVDLGGAYKHYAAKSLEGHSFFYVDSFGQWLLALCLVFKNKAIGKVTKHNMNLRILWLASVFDIIVLPFSSILGVWRGYEFLYLVRLSMYAFLMALLLKDAKPSTKQMVQIITLLILVCWMTYRVSRTFEDSALLPYIFEPFMDMLVTRF